MKKLKHIALILSALLIWTIFVGFGIFQGFLLKPITSEQNPEAFIDQTKNEISKEFVGNFAMILIEKGKISKEYYYSEDKSINNKSLFPVASISKWITSFGVLKLVEEGKLDLDKPINSYLTRWQLPKSDFDNNKVTARRLLSHSAGLIDDLGYAGFTSNEKAQTLEESLTKAADAPYSAGVAIVGYEPGTKYMYSGAGYTLLQLLIEEVTQQSFQEYMTKNVFEPLQMNHSTFVLSEKPNLKLVDIYQNDGQKRPFNNFTALAAASLFTCTSDLSKFLIANISNNTVISQKSIKSMSNAETFINDIGVYGLGPHLYSQNDKNSKIIGHDGSGNNAINTAARINLKSKDGIIILETGSFNIASSLADEWLFWKAGIADYIVIQRNKPFLLAILIIGYFFIILCFLLLKKRIT